MGATRSNTVLGRIAAAGREDHQARAMSLQKAMRVTLAKVANSLMNLPLAVIGSVMQELSSEGLEAIISDEMLLLMLDGPGQLGGAVLIESYLVGGLIQQQTIGTVRPDTGAARQMTRTDAAICAPLLDALFQKVPTIVDSTEDARLVEGFRFGAKAEHSRSLLMSLDAPRYKVLRLTIDLSRGVRQGEMIVILPVHIARVTATDSKDDATEKTLRTPDMSKVVMGLTTNLNMVLCRKTLTLMQVQKLKPGDVLDIPSGLFPNVQICEVGGRVLGQGTVGHVDGIRAVKPKRKPLHATQPLRRADDQEHVDMPKVEEIGDRRRTNGIAATDANKNHAGALPASDAALPVQIGDVNKSDVLPDPLVATSQGRELEKTTLEALPELEDLPDLADLPDLVDLSDNKLPIAS